MCIDMDIMCYSEIEASPIFPFLLPAGRDVGAFLWLSGLPDVRPESLLSPAVWSRLHPELLPG